MTRSNQKYFSVQSEIVFIIFIIEIFLCSRINKSLAWSNSLLSEYFDMVIVDPHLLKDWDIVC